ncbi:allophanate hydrolase [Niveibacterium sp. 24ML]|uniref:allophanate hydrolase n=1 Tax=Niveibacterium sp. 24ML TaxID=2985512 RepID=UPI002271AA93|nr:allophanate hydrolase [Niveibacterium sp. 24ML]MCX9154523.1 allophanate hydrolase [Niveibacterium sp. 24ML]
MRPAGLSSDALSLDIASLRAAYLAGGLTPLDVVEVILRRTVEDPNCVWITRLPDDVIRGYASTLAGRDPASLPLYGIPFAIKDNIDLAGVPTTAACREFAYQPDANAFVVQRLIDAGAIPIGKTNLDQFATGLNGTRSPWGACRNAFNPEYISGGSSSGSAVAVAKGYVSFALGTDTAGSGRVPAAFNNLVGHKPTLGWLSTCGVVPACRSLDTVSIFALTAEDAEAVTCAAAAFDADDCFARKQEGHGFDFGSANALRVGVPKASQLAFFGNTEAERLFGEALARLESLGGELVEIDLQPFLDTAKMLYEGPWVAERYAAIRAFFDASPEAPLPVIREIIGGARQWSAADAYTYGYRLKAAKRQCDAVWQAVDTIITPSAGTIYTIAQMLADPIRLNANLGTYTNFMNLLDYAATAVPAGFQSDGLPFGVTVFAPAHQDGPLLRLAARMQRALGSPLGASGLALPAVSAHPRLAGGQVRVAVCGAHLRGLPLNGQLTSRGARLVAEVMSAPEYRFVALPGGPPYRPGMIRVASGGCAVQMEIWEMPATAYGSFVAGIPAPLGIGTVRLGDGSSVQGFVCEAAAAEGAEDISHFGGWRAYLAAH